MLVRLKGDGDRTYGNKNAPSQTFTHASIHTSFYTHTY